LKRYGVNSKQERYFCTKPRTISKFIIFSIEMPPEHNLLNYFFGGIIANLPLWIFSLFYTIITQSLISLFILVILGILGGAIAGYLMSYKTGELHKWAPLYTGSLAFFASILILGETAPDLADFIVLPGFILGMYLGINLYKAYPIKKSATNFPPIREIEKNY
jgi:hypothetical protein